MSYARCMARGMAVSVDHWALWPRLKHFSFCLDTHGDQGMNTIHFCSKWNIFIITTVVAFQCVHLSTVEACCVLQHPKSKDPTWCSLFCHQESQMPSYSIWTQSFLEFSVYHTSGNLRGWKMKPMRKVRKHAVPWMSTWDWLHKWDTPLRPPCFCCSMFTARYIKGFCYL